MDAVWRVLRPDREVCFFLLYPLPTAHARAHVAMTTVHDITIYEGYDELFGWHLGQDEMEDESSERI